MVLPVALNNPMQLVRVYLHNQSMIFQGNKYSHVVLSTIKKKEDIAML